jgi:hypothetical protein
VGCCQTLEVSVDYITATADGPLDNLHAAETAGVVALLLSLEEVELVIRAFLQRIALEMGKVVPLAESLDVVIANGLRLRRGVARVLVDLR